MNQLLESACACVGMQSMHLPALFSKKNIKSLIIMNLICCVCAFAYSCIIKN
jgi:hypothetical protein